jgi:hypothetical protein
MYKVSDGAVFVLPNTCEGTMVMPAVAAAAPFKKDLLFMFFGFVAEEVTTLKA